MKEIILWAIGSIAAVIIVDDIADTAMQMSDWPRATFLSVFLVCATVVTVALINAVAKEVKK